MMVSYEFLKTVDKPSPPSMAYKHNAQQDSSDFVEKDSKIYLRLTSISLFREQLENWLFKSMVLFFPKHLASKIIVFDREKEADRE